MKPEHYSETAMFDLLKWLLANNPPGNDDYLKVTAAVKQMLGLLTQFLLAYHTMGDKARAYNELLAARLSFGKAGLGKDFPAGDQGQNRDNAINDAIKPLQPQNRAQERPPDHESSRPRPYGVPSFKNEEKKGPSALIE